MLNLPQKVLNISPAVVRTFLRCATSLSPSSAEYQYLEKSTIPTYHFQRSLQHLPIPKLEDTCKRYLTALRPILDDQQYGEAEKIIKSFESNEGKRLHEELVKHDKRNNHTSYITEPWFDMYLSARTSPPIHFTPAIGFAPDPNQKYNHQLARATNMVLSIGRFKRSLDEQVLRPEIFHLNAKKTDTPMFRTICKMLPQRISWYGAIAASKARAFPLDMSQHPSLFNTTRIPKIGKDEIFRQHNPPAKHFMVMRKGHIFAVKLFDEQGHLLSPSDVHGSLSHILSLPLNNAEYPLGVLTTMDRDLWAQTRTELIGESGKNMEAIHKIDESLFCLCLDDLQTEDPERLIKNLLYGDDGTNRWWDKSISLLMHSNGFATINFEHSWGDGVACLRLIEDVYKDSCKNHFVDPETKAQTQTDLNQLVQPIEVDLTDSLKNAIKKQQEKYVALGNSLGFSWIEYNKLNRDYIRKQRLGPDALMQLAVQMSFYRSTGRRVATYESCSTSAFKHGRTETMRPATNETKRTVDAFLAKDRPNHGELRGMINKCSKLHNQLVKEASMGQGFDRHLLGLKVTAERLGQPIPSLYDSSFHKFANNFVLSSSTLSTETIVMGGFAPVVSDGYGIGYNVVGNRMGCFVSAYKDNRSPKEFTDAMKLSLDEIYEVLERTKSG